MKLGGIQIFTEN